MSKRLSWPPIVAEAARIAYSYSTPPTLRQVFYRLVSAGIIPNTETAYNSLSDRTSKARREGRCPPFSDGTRSVHRLATFADPAEALNDLAAYYRLDRTEGQESQVWLMLEKATLSDIAEAVANPYGVPVVAVRGYGSQTIIDKVRDDMTDDGRPVVAFYVGDFDPSGEDIERDLFARLGVPIDLTRLAVLPSQIASMGLVPRPGKKGDSRAAGFAKRHGALVQVEAEAIDPATLEALMRDAIASVVDASVFDEVVEREDVERRYLNGIARAGE